MITSPIERNYIFQNPVERHFKPSKAAVYLPDRRVTIKCAVTITRIWDGCQTPLFLLTLLSYVLTMVRGGGTPCVPSLSVLFSSRLLMLAYWLLVDTVGIEPNLCHCKWHAFPLSYRPMCGRRRILNSSRHMLSTYCLIKSQVPFPFGYFANDCKNRIRTCKTYYKV